MYLSKTSADSGAAMKAAISLSGRSTTVRPIQLQVWRPYKGSTEISEVKNWNVYQWKGELGTFFLITTTLFSSYEYLKIYVKNIILNIMYVLAKCACECRVVLTATGCPLWSQVEPVCVSHPRRKHTTPAAIHHGCTHHSTARNILFLCLAHWYVSVVDMCSPLGTMHDKSAIQ